MKYNKFILLFIFFLSIYLPQSCNAKNINQQDGYSFIFKLGDYVPGVRIAVKNAQNEVIATFSNFNQEQMAINGFIPKTMLTNGDKLYIKIIFPGEEDKEVAIFMVDFDEPNLGGYANFDAWHFNAGRHPPIGRQIFVYERGSWV